MLPALAHAPRESKCHRLAHRRAAVRIFRLRWSSGPRSARNTCEPYGAAQRDGLEAMVRGFCKRLARSVSVRSASYHTICLDHTRTYLNRGKAATTNGHTTSRLRYESSYETAHPTPASSSLHRGCSGGEHSTCGRSGKRVSYRSRVAAALKHPRTPLNSSRCWS